VPAEEFGRPARLDAGIWPNIRNTTEFDRARHERWFRDETRAWAAGHLDRLPRSLHNHVLEGWDIRYGVRGEGDTSSVSRANRWVREALQDFGDARAGRAYDEAAIRDHAENYATMCARMHSLEHRAKFAAWFGITPPAGQRVTRAGAIKRLDDPLWWRWGPGYWRHAGWRPGFGAAWGPGWGWPPAYDT